MGFEGAAGIEGVGAVVGLGEVPLGVLELQRMNSAASLENMLKHVPVQFQLPVGEIANGMNSSNG